MATESEPADDLDVRLRWPAEGRRDGGAEATGTPAPLPALTPRPVGAAEGPFLRMGPIQDALAALSARIDSLTTATSTFRAVMGDRLTDFSDQVNRVQAGTARTLDEGRRMQDQIMTGIEAALEETEAGLARLDTVTTSLLHRLDDLGALVGSEERVTGHVERSTEAVTRTVESRSDDVVRAVAALRASTEESFADLASRVDAARPEDLSGPLEEVRAALAARPVGGAQDLDAVLDALDALDAGLAEVAARPVAVGDLSGLTARLDGLAELVTELRGRPLPAGAPDTTGILERLDALAEQVGGLQAAAHDGAVTAVDGAGIASRLDELSELVADLLERPAPSSDPAGVAGLAGRLDEVADLLGDLSGRAPSEVDLGPVERRLDEMADSLTAVAGADPSAVDLSPLEARIGGMEGAIDDLAAQLPGAPEVAALTDSLRRLERTAPTLAGAEQAAELMAAVTRVEAVVEALADVSEDASSSDDLAALRDALEALSEGMPALGESLAARQAASVAELARHIDEVNAATAARVTEALDRASARLEPSTGPAAAAGEDGAVIEAVEAVEETLGKLAAAQAEDLERVLDAVEEQAATAPTVVEALARIEAAIERPARTAGRPIGNAQQLGDELAALTREVGALRRRLALRARPLDDEAIAALADALAERITVTAARPAVAAGSAVAAGEPLPASPGDPPPTRRRRRQT